MNNQGILFISPKTAKLTRNTDFFTKMDPYVIITCGDQVKQTKTHKSGGKKPRWDDTLKFRVRGEDFITISVYDQDPLVDDHVGSAVYNLAYVYSNKECKDWIPLTHKNKPAGQLYMEFDFVSQQPETDTQTSEAFYSSLHSYGKDIIPSYYINETKHPAQPKYSHAPAPPTNVPYAAYQHAGGTPVQMYSEPAYPQAHPSQFAGFLPPNMAPSYPVAPNYAQPSYPQKQTPPGYVGIPYIPGSTPSYTVPYNPYAPVGQH